MKPTPLASADNSPLALEPDLPHTASALNPPMNGGQPAMPWYTPNFFQAILAALQTPPGATAPADSPPLPGNPKQKEPSVTAPCCIAPEFALPPAPPLNLTTAQTLNSTTPQADNLTTLQPLNPTTTTQPQNLTTPQPVNLITPPPHNLILPASAADTVANNTTTPAQPNQSAPVQPQSTQATDGLLLAIAPIEPDANAPAPIANAPLIDNLPARTPNTRPPGAANTNAQTQLARQFFPSNPVAQLKFPSAAITLAAPQLPAPEPSLVISNPAEIASSLVNSGLPHTSDPREVTPQTSDDNPFAHGGMTVAKPFAQMKSLPSEHPAAPSSEQTLPANFSAPRASGGSNSETADSGAARHFSGPGPELSASQFPMPHRTQDAATQSSHTVSTPAPRTVEHSEALITQQVAQLRHFGADSLSVVLRPDPHTELSLHLSTRNGNIEASVRFDRGEFAPFQTHWGELQQKLAEQQVRLLPLREPVADAHSPSFYHDGHGNSQHSHTPRRQSAPDHALDEELAWIGSNTDPIKRRTRTNAAHAIAPGWETWA